MEPPEIRYLSTERGDIAYQAFGEGDRAIVWTGSPFVSVELRWEHPGSVRLWDFLASLGRVVLFDYRGFGISEHLPLDQVGQLDEMAFDLEAIVGEAGMPTVVIATGHATIPAVRLATTRPGAIERLVLLNAAPTDPLRGQVDPKEWAAEARDGWGTGKAMVRAAGNTVDDARRRIAARGERIAATPAVVEAAVLALLQHDVTALLPHVTVPTLVVHTGDVARVTPEMSERVASGIPGAVYLSRPSALFNWGEWDADIKRFVTGEDAAADGYRDLAAVLFTDIVGSTEHAARVGDTAWRETLGYLDAIVHLEVSKRQGRVVKQTGDGHLIEFARPGDALSGARALLDGVRQLGLELRAGVHYAEIERRPDGDIGGLAVHVAARIASLAQAGELLVSRTVTELTAGSSRRYVHRGARTLKGVPGEWDVYAATDG